MHWCARQCFCKGFGVEPLIISRTVKPPVCSERCTAAHLLGDVGPEGLDEGHVLGPVQEVHGHAVQQARPARPGGQADVQLVQVVAAARGPGPPLYLPGLRQACRQHARRCQQSADLITEFLCTPDAVCDQ